MRKLRITGKLWYLLFPLAVIVGLVTAVPAEAQSGYEWQTIWQWSADSDGAYQPKFYGAVYGIDGGFEHVQLDGSTNSGSAILFQDYNVIPQSANLRITIEYRTSNSASPRLRFGNPTDSNDYCQPTALSFPIPRSSEWTVLSEEFSWCSLNVGQEYVFSLRNVGLASYRWLIRSVRIESYFPAPPPPPPASQSGISGASCTLVIDTTSGAVITATQTLTNTPTLTNTQTVTVTANLIRNGTLETPSPSGNTPAPAHWEWNRPIYAPAQWQLDGSNRVIAAAPTAEPTLLIRQALTQTLPAATYMYGLDTAYSAGPADVIVRMGLVPTGSGGGGGGGIVTLFDALPEQFSYSPTISQTWRTVTGTLSTSGNRYLSVALPENDGSNQLAIDNLFIVPVESDGAGGWRVRCATIGELYTPTPPETPAPAPPPVAGAVTLAAALGGRCYDCQPPRFRWDISLIGLWFVYLGCIITNVITCHLYAWLFSMMNLLYWVGGLTTAGINATISGLNIFLNWVATGAQGTINWGANVYIAGRDLLGMALAWGGGVMGNALNGFAYVAMQIGNILNPGNAMALLTSLGEVVLALVEFIVSPVLALVNIVIAVAETVWEVAAAVVNALTATPEDIDQWATSPNANINSDMIIVLLWIMGTVDHSLAVYHMVPAVYMMVGAMGLMAFKKWSEKWESILPI